MKEMHLKAGDVLIFTDAITHGSAERTNDGYRRSVIYRYSPRHIRTRFNYAMSDELSDKIVEAIGNFKSHYRPEEEAAE